MARVPSIKIERAKAMYLEGVNLITISKELDVPEGTVRRWKCTHNWDNERLDKKSVRSKKTNEREKKKNKINTGNEKGTKGPPRNQNAVIHGLYSKWLPEETADILKTVETMDPLEILWQNIQLQYAAIIRAQKIMHVVDKEDKTKELCMDGKFESYQVQQAWDKQASFLKAQASAQKTLETMIGRYYELLNLSNATTLQTARIDLLRAQVNKLNESESSKNEEQLIIVNDLNDIVIDEEENS